MVGVNEIQRGSFQQAVARAWWSRWTGIINVSITGIILLLVIWEAACESPTRNEIRVQRRRTFLSPRYWNPSMRTSLKQYVVTSTRWFQPAAVLTAVISFAACGGPPPPAGPTPSQSGSSSSPTFPVPNANDPLDGTFTLTLQIGSSCSAIQDAEKTRVYEATIGPAANRTYLGHVVTLAGAHFLSGPICTPTSGMYAGIGCDQFLASEDLDWVGFYLQNNNDEAHGAHIVEQLSSGGWLEITGHADGAFPNASLIDVNGTADVWACLTSSAYPYPCSDSRFCPATDLHLRFSRK
jgi:hypothetical protein